MAKLIGGSSGMASEVEMCGYRSAREIGSDGSEMIGKSVWTKQFWSRQYTASGSGADTGIPRGAGK